jgi:hypothetical protein
MKKFTFTPSRIPLENDEQWRQILASADMLFLGNPYGEIKGALIEMEPVDFPVQFAEPIPLVSGVVLNGKFNTIWGCFEFVKDRLGLCSSIHVDKVIMFSPEDKQETAFGSRASLVSDRPEDFGITDCKFENIWLTGYRRGFDFAGTMPLNNEISVKARAPRGEIVRITFGGTNKVRVGLEGAHYPLTTGSLVECSAGGNHIDGCLLEGFGDREGPVGYFIGGHGTTFTRNYAEMHSTGGFTYVFDHSQDLKIDGFNVSPGARSKVRFQNRCFATVGCVFLDHDDFSRTMDVDKTSRVFIEEVKSFGRPTLPNLRIGVGRIVTMNTNEIWTPVGGWRRM